MTPSLRLALALIALLAPAGLGALGALVAAARGGHAGDVLAPILLALAALVPAAADPGTEGAPGDGPRGLEVAGVWRQPPSRAPYLQTRAGPLPIVWSEAVLAPPPGTPLRLLARVRPGRPALVVTHAATGPPRGALLDRWHAACAGRIRALLPPDAGGLVRALVLGDRSDLAFPVRAACVRTGTMHVLALSGLHVGVLAGLLAAGARRLAWRVQAPCLVAFVALCGPKAPLVRAGLGWLVADVARAHGGSVRGPRRLGVVALLMLVAHPAWRDDLAFQLSFLAVAGLVALRLPWWCGGLGAFLATAPLVAECFGRVQPWGLLVTPFVMPPVALVLALGALAVLPLDALSILDPLWAGGLRGAALALEATLATAQALVPEPWPVALPAGSGVPAGLAVVALLAACGRRRPPGWEPP